MKLYRCGTTLTPLRAPEDTGLIAVVTPQELPQVLEGADLMYARQLLPLRGAYCCCDVGLDHVTGQLLIPDPVTPEQPGRSACFFIDRDILCLVDEGDLIKPAIESLRSSFADQGSTRERFIACLVTVFLRGHGEALETCERRLRSL